MKIIPRKSVSDEGILMVLPEIDVYILDRATVFSVSRKSGVSEKIYYGEREKFGSMGRLNLSETRASR